MSQLYQNIKFICKKKKISIATLETQAGLGQNTIPNWDRSIPSADRVLKVAQVLDVSIDYLLGNTNDPTSHKASSAKEIEIWKQVQEFVSYKIDEVQKNKPSTDSEDGS